MSNAQNISFSKQKKYLPDNSEHYLLPVFSQKNVRTNKVNMEYIDIESLVDYIRLGKDFFRITNRLGQPTEPKFNWEKICWSGLVNPNLNGNFEQPCKRIGFQLRNLTNERWEIIYDKLCKSRYTNVLFGNKTNGIISVVTKVNCIKFSDYKIFYKKIVNYYRTYCHLGKMDLITGNANIGLRHILYFDPEVLYNPKSEYVQLDEDINTNEMIYESSAVVENFPQKASAFDDERKTTKLLSNITEWYDEYFLMADHESHHVDTGVQIHIKPDKESNTIRNVSFFNNQDGKKNEFKNFQYDIVTGAIVICSTKSTKTKSNSNQRKATIPDVCNLLVKVLTRGEVKQGDFQRQAAKEFTCSVETIENRIKEIFKDPSIIHKSTGNPVVLVKRHEGFKNFLSLKSIE